MEGRGAKYRTPYHYFGGCSGVHALSPRKWVQQTGQKQASNADLSTVCIMKVETCSGLIQSSVLTSIFLLVTIHGLWARSLLISCRFLSFWGTLSSDSNHDRSPPACRYSAVCKCTRYVQECRAAAYNVMKVIDQTHDVNVYIYYAGNTNYTDISIINYWHFHSMPARGKMVTSKLYQCKIALIQI